MPEVFQVLKVFGATLACRCRRLEALLRKATAALDQLNWLAGSRNITCHRGGKHKICSNFCIK